MRLEESIRRDRLLATAIELMAVPSPTGEAGAAADRLAEILAGDGFAVERPAAGHPAAPAVAVRLAGARPGPSVQFEGHLDTVHLPFAPPRVEGDRLRGSGAADMKAGLAAAVEALRALRDAGGPAAGAILLTAHDLHEAPWGFGEQLERLIQEGRSGDAVLIPEPLSDRLPVIGRGAAVLKASISRPGPAVHEVMRPPGAPSVIAAAAALIEELGRLGTRLAEKRHPLAGAETVFIGQVHAGEIYNQDPPECRLEGTRRWLPDTSREEAERELRGIAAETARRFGVEIALGVQLIRDAFRLEAEHPFARSFQEAHRAVRGAYLPAGPKPFVDDGNLFWSLSRLPAITHGPLAGGQHTTDEWVSIDDLVRVARIYALTAARFCGGIARTQA